VSRSASTPVEPKITVVFLLYHAARVVPALVDLLARQSHREFPRQSDWLAALFMDDASSDDTAQVLARSLHGAGAPSHYRMVLNPENLGLAGTLNKAFGLARTPYALTCHLDCRFGREDYVARMLELMEGHPRAAAITGQPAVAADTALPFAEKLNLISNLMDIFPASEGEELVPVGFAEGRCDVFRLEALRAVGFYDTTLRVAGEDQVLAGKLRRAGYEIYQAPRLTYYLSVSGEQDTVGKLVRHQRLFGRAHPYILILNRESRGGVVGDRAGMNRQRRLLLRTTQLAATGVYVFVAAALVLGWPAWWWGGALALLALAKGWLFLRHLRAVPFTAREFGAFVLLQPLLDASYTVGFVQGLWRVAGGTNGRSID
jgi:GT2 family glycosyltransferase